MASHGGLRDAVLPGQRRVDGPLDLLIPLARRHEANWLRQARAGGAAVAQVFTHALRRFHQALGAADQRRRGVQRPARTVDDGLRGRALLLVQQSSSDGSGR